MKTVNPLLLVVVLLICYTTYAQPAPPPGKKWKKIENLSDEFNNGFNTNKWAKNIPTWEGRKPARFETANVSVSNGNLKLIAKTKDKPFSGWTHEGAAVRSIHKAPYGYYETKMKANKTFMSSTFWLINEANQGTSACDRRVTELDVVEVVGIDTRNPNGSFPNKMNSNSHSRQPWCSNPPGGQLSNCPWPAGCNYTRGSVGNKADIGEPSWADYHTYGVWYKNKDQATFYLDGKDVGTINLPSDFNLDMFLRFVVETYDWNPPKSGKDGMNSSLSDRTTYYDWVRSYELVDDNTPTTDKVAFSNPPTSIPSQKSYTFNINYQANTNREIVVEFWSASKWLGNKVETVSKGSGAKPITITLSEAPTPGTGYLYKTHIRPIGTTWREAIDRDQIDNITVQAAQLINNGNYFIGSSNQRLLARGLENHSARMHNPGNWNDQKWTFNHLGNNVYTIKNLGSNRFLEVPNGQCGNGKNVATWTGSSKDHQKWIVTENSNGIYNLQPLHCTSAALDRAGGATDANVHLWSYSKTNNNQKWSITPIAAAKFKNKFSSPKISMYPNPTLSTITISGLEKNDTIKIINANGQELFSKKTDSDSEIINTDFLNSGMYFISVVGKSTAQIVKK
ncbi:RICIN domain-containing protein [Tenacibaculum agarivorans]|uniref:RICIN domain-containing protein n=1 Tax=Tenacibaculum agarivorans TaxID=1908389 RepID=UPI00094BA01F|nr:RICIN domain-containing protein [Tenacibaculum agarivorans]